MNKLEQVAKLVNAARGAFEGLPRSGTIAYNGVAARDGGMSSRIGIRRQALVKDK